MRVDLPNFGAKSLTSSIRRFLGNLLAAGGSSRVTRGGIAHLAVLSAGTTGYMVIEDWSVLALCKSDGTILFTPESRTVMEPGDGVIVLDMGDSART